MLHRNIANRYANALFGLAKDNGQLETVEADFPRIAEFVRSNEDLRNFIEHPAIIGEEKKKIIRGLFKDNKVNELLYDFLCLTVDKRREAYIPMMCEGYLELLMQYRNRQEAEVETPFELSEDLQKALSAKLEKVTGKNVVLKQIIDTKLIGGIRVRMGDRVVDGSIVHRLSRMKEALQSARV